MFLRGGDYTLRNTLQFDEKDSGTEDVPVVWSAYENEKVTLSNSDKIPLGSFSVSNDSRIPESARGKVYSYNLRDNGIDGYDGLYLAGHSQHFYWAFGMAEPGAVQYGYPVPEVFFGEQTGRLAEYPNNQDWMGITGVVNRGTKGWFTGDYEGTKLDSWVGATMSVNIDKNRMKRWENAKNPWYDSYWSYDWSDFRGPLEKIDAENQTIKTKHALPWDPNVKTARWRIYNLIEELDAPGEWFYDEDSGELFIYPYDNMTSSDEITLAFQKKNVIELSNAHDITFEKLNITGTRFSGIVGNNCDRIEVSDCRIYNLSSNGIVLTQSNDCKLLNNTIENVGAKGMQLTGGDGDTLTPSGILAQNNLITNYARLQKAYIGAFDVHGVGVTLKNNEICNSSQLAIAYGGNDHLFVGNDIHDVLKEASDMGAIYRISGFSSRGTVIKNNAFHDLKTSSSDSTGIFAVYFDGAAPGDTVTENVFYDIDGTCVFMNGGRNLTVTNNIFVDIAGNGVRFACIDGNHSGFKSISLGDVAEVIKNPAYHKYPNFVETYDGTESDPRATKNCVIDANLGCNIGNIITYDLGNSAGSKTTYAWLTANNKYDTGWEGPTAWFVDYAGRNFSLLGGIHEDIKNGKYPNFKNIDMSKIGIQQ